MLIDKRDIDLLRLISLCKDVPADCSPLKSDMFSAIEFSTLICAGYIHKSKCKRSYRLTDRGCALLKQLDCSVEKDKYPVGSGGVLARRLEVAKTILSLYRAGLDVFGDVTEGLRVTPSFHFRRKGRGDILGASEMCSVIHSETQIIPAYFITRTDKLNATSELSAIRRLSALWQYPNELVFLFLADDMETLENFPSPFEQRAIKAVWGTGFAEVLSWELYEPLAEPLEVSLYAQ